MRWPVRIGESGEWLAVGASVLLHGVAVAVALSLGGRADPVMPEGSVIPVVWEMPAVTEPPASSPVVPPPATAAIPQAVEQSVPPTLPRRTPAARPAPRQIAQAPAPAPAVSPSPPAPSQPAKPASENAPIAEARPAPEIASATAAPPASPAPPSSTALAAVPSGRATGWSVLLRDPPKYPPAARRRGIEGEVILLAEVGPDGAVEAVSLVRSSGYPELDDAAMTAVEKWRFRAPSRLSIQIPITFRLDKD